MKKMLHKVPAAFSRRADAAASHNERLLLDLILRKGTVGRAELAKDTGLTLQSISRLVDGLADRGLVRFGARVSERGSSASGFGVELVAEAAYTIGISIMTDALSIAIMNLRGDLVATHYEPLADVTADAVLARVQQLTTSMVGDHVSDRSRLLGAGLAFTGYFVEDGRALNPPDPLADFALVDLRDLFSRWLGLEVIVENDGSAAAIAESFLGVGRRHPTFAYIHFAAGVGGGVVIDGQPLRGAHGNAGELAGVIPTHRFGDRPTLGLLVEMIEQHGGGARTIDDLVRNFDPELPGIDQWIERVREPLNMIVSSLGAIVDPAAIVLGGRMPRALAGLLIPQIEIFSAPRRGVPRAAPDIVPAEAGTEPTAVGAAVLPFKAHLFV